MPSAEPHARPFGLHGRLAVAACLTADVASSPLSSSSSRQAFPPSWRHFRASLFLTCKFTINLQLSEYIFYRNTYQNYIYTFFAFSQQLFIIASRRRSPRPSSPVPLPPPPCDADASIPATASHTTTYATPTKRPAKGRLSPRKRPLFTSQKAAFRKAKGRLSE